MCEKCKDDDHRPRICNTGAQNTQGFPLRPLVDWVSATFLGSTPPWVVKEILKMDKCDFIQMERGMKGYKSHLRFGHISVLYDGTEAMGVHVEISGQGCREYELLHDDSWYDLFGRILKYGHFTRLDLAIDDFYGYFTIAQLVDYLRKGSCRSRFKKAIRIESILIEDGSTEGQTLYFGSPSSRIKVRFYDKLRERMNAGKEIEEGVTFWNRTEVEARDARANLLAATICHYRDDGGVIAGVLKNYISFLKKGTCSNKARWPIAKFWEDFLGDVEKIKLTEVAPDRTVDTIHHWIDKQVSKSLGVLFLAYDSDIRWLRDLIDKGMDGLTDKEMMMIDAYKSVRDKDEKNKLVVEDEFTGVHFD